MNKTEYLRALKEALKNIDVTIMEEIFADYEEHFQLGMENGKSEEQICEELGSIDDLVKEINEVYGIDGTKKQAYEDESCQQKEYAKDDSGQQKEHAEDDSGQQYWGFNTDRISNTINRVLDSTSDAINKALHATSEAISKVDSKEIGRQIKSSLEHAVSHLNDYADNSFGIYHGSFDESRMNSEYYQDNVTKSYDNSYPGEQKINIVVDGLCANIHVKQSTDDKINIRYENNGNERQKQKYAFYSFMEGNTIYAGVRLVGSAVFLFNLKAYAFIHLEIPENIGFVDIKTANGDIRITDVSPERISAQTASGDISFNQVDAEEINIVSTSGDIQAGSSKSERINVRSVSGDIEAKSLTAKELSLKTTSGDIDTEHTEGDIISCISMSGSLDIVGLKANEGKFKSTSGSAEIRDSAINTADIGSISGDISLSNIAGENLIAETTSGDVELDVNVRKCRAGSKSGDVDAVFSGDVALESSSSSGSINIRLKNYGNGYLIESRTVSGNLSIHYNDQHQRNLKRGTYTYGNQGSKLILSSMSGDIRVSD